MNVSAINCTPIKPKVSFGNNDTDYTKVAQQAEAIKDEYVNADRLKSPAGVVASVAACGLKAFASGAVLASLFAGIAKGAPTKLQGALKKGSQGIRKFAADLSDDAAKHAKVKKPIGKAIAKVEQVARNAYKKVINPNTTAIADDMADDVVNAIHAQNNRALQKMVGIGTAAAVLPAATTVSNDGDEVPDMLQKFEAGANKVTGATTRATADLTALQNLVDIVASAGA